MLSHVRIEGGHEVIEQPVAEQDHFDVERDRVGLKRHRAGQADEAPDILDPDLTLAQRPLQREPAERLHQEHTRIEQQEAAIGAVDRACPSPAWLTKTLTS